MIDQHEFNAYALPLGTTARSGSMVSRSTTDSSPSFFDRLKATAQKAATAVSTLQSSAAGRTSASSSAALSSRSRNSTPVVKQRQTATSNTIVSTTGRSGVEHDPDAPRTTTTGQSPRASQARTPEENNNVMHASRYLAQFKALAKEIEEQGFVLNQAQHRELQGIIAQYQKFKGDEATLNLMLQYNHLPVEGGISSDNPMMAAFGNLDAKKAMIIGGVILGIAVLKKAAAKTKKRVNQ
ncbi:hypothetical protein [Catalinimonas niigatensis]|uniref:hypothetical protein n=1 Tax=Catalinimonas niigatensis TaxID=1397264 RepID=UPI002665EAFF|nr:hypothetical protein [Catalinimonas niigatensis]WPP49623.1 hypothetical protein PZB72_23395 [Catalinimonas niigatensis]